MRYRALDAAGDMQFGRGAAAFLHDSPEAVAQAIRTRLLLFRGEWFADTTAGTAWSSRILGERTEDARLPELRDRILGTPGVRALLVLEAAINPDTRRLAVRAEVDTIYGRAAVETDA